MDTESPKKGHERIYELLIEKDDITWQTIIHDLVRTEEMNPWDVDVSLLTAKYIETLKQLKSFDFRVTGKVILCAAMLLKMKSSRLVDEDIALLDRMMAGTDEDEFFEDMDLIDENVPRSISGLDKSKLIPRTPQPRKRKVSIYDLVEALEQALEVKRRRVLKHVPTMNIDLPTRGDDIGILIKQIYYKILRFFSINRQGTKLTFTQLIPADTREDKVLTFIPLLHLTNLRKIDLHQDEEFGEIKIALRTEKDIQKELGIVV